MVVAAVGIAILGGAAGSQPAAGAPPTVDTVEPASEPADDVGVPAGDDVGVPAGDEQPPPDQSPNSPDSGDVPATTEPPTDSSTVPGQDGEATDEEDDAETTPVARPSSSPNVRDSGIPLGSIVLAVAVLLAVGVAAVVLARRGGTAGSGARLPEALDRVAPPSSERTTTGERSTDGTRSNAATLEFLLELGDALVDAGNSVGQVESMVRQVAAANGIERLGVLVMPSAIMLSVDHGESVATEVRTTRAVALRLDQVDDLMHLVRDAAAGSVDARDGHREIDRIRNADPPYANRLVLFGYVVSSIGLALLLRGQAIEIAIAALLGVVIGGVRLATASLDASYQAFWPLIAAGTSSACVFASARFIDDLAVFPALIAPLIVFLPGALLTTAVLELATGDMVSGASRLAAGGMRLVLLAIGVLAGARLVGVPGGDIRTGIEGVAGTLAPWVGVAVFGVGVGWFYGARRETIGWIVVVLYGAYAGQVLGGMFFGGSLSAFFGALAMTPLALLVAQQPSGPTPLVTFLPGFWLLVPGALGLEGVTRLFSEGGVAAFDVLVSTVTSMVAISLGVLLGLVVSGVDPARPLAATRVSTR